MTQKELQEAAEKIYPKHKGLTATATNKIMLRRNTWVKGAKWMQGKIFSKKDMIDFGIWFYLEINQISFESRSNEELFDEWYNKFKKQ
jgi:hypothetical protein